jgi:hypothetical protein
MPASARAPGWPPPSCAGVASIGSRCGAHTKWPPWLGGWPCGVGLPAAWGAQEAATARDAPRGHRADARRHR